MLSDARSYARLASSSSRYVLLQLLRRWCQSHGNTLGSLAIFGVLISFILIIFIVLIPWKLGAPADLEAVYETYWSAELANSPAYATLVGDHSRDAAMSVPSLTATAQWHTRLAYTLRRFGEEFETARKMEVFSEQQLIDALLFRYYIEESLALGRYNMSLLPLSIDRGPHRDFPELIRMTEAHNTTDYQNLMTRMTHGFRAHVVGLEQLLTAGKRQAPLPYVPARLVVESVPRVIDALVESIKRGTSVFDAALAGAPASEADAKAAALQAVRETYELLRNWIVNNYLPDCRHDNAVGVMRLPRGEEFYDFRVKQMLSREANMVSLRASARARIETLKQRIGAIQAARPGAAQLSRADWLDTLAAQHHFSSPEKLAQSVSYVAKQIARDLPRLFDTMPSCPLALRNMDDGEGIDAEWAVYTAPSLPCDRPGVLAFNTHDLTSRFRYLYYPQLLALGEPGHHFQTALQIDSAMPNSRKSLNVFDGVYAFTAGWSLYVHELRRHFAVLNDEGEALDEQLVELGFLTAQLIAAARVLIDIDLHGVAPESVSTVSEVLSGEVPLNDEQIMTEIKYVIAEPGRAIGAYVGLWTVLKLRSVVRREHERAGGRWLLPDLKRFHARVLANGALPLDVLRNRILEYYNIAGDAAADVLKAPDYVFNFDDDHVGGVDGNTNANANANKRAAKIVEVRGG